MKPAIENSFGFTIAKHFEIVLSLKADKRLQDELREKSSSV